MAQLGALLLLGAGAFALTQLPKKNKRKSKADLPPEGCELYPWQPDEVDAAIKVLTDAGERDPDKLAMHAARLVYPTTPEGTPQTWPPKATDLRGICILDRIRIRVNLALAQLAEADADRPTLPPERCPPGFRFLPPLGRCVPTRPDPDPEPQGPGGFTPLPDPEPPPEPEPPSEPEDPGEWPDYPPPGPVDLAKWWPPENYPTPGKFHQVGDQNSGTTLKAIARKALTTAFYLVHNDLELADKLARRSENWRTYRDIINCSPWNHALYGSANDPGSPHHYDTPHGHHVSLYPVHEDVAARLLAGEPPARRVSETNPSAPSGGVHAFLWLPPLDEGELLAERVKVKHEHWWTGDWVMMPPPEVLALQVQDVPPGKRWGCLGYETEYAYDEEEGQ